MSKIFDRHSSHMIHYGLVIGGPLNGRNLDHYAPHYRVPLAPKFEAYPNPGPEISIEPLKTFDYKHVVGLRGEFNFDFWVPENRDAAWALRRLVDSYRQEDNS